MALALALVPTEELRPEETEQAQEAQEVALPPEEAQPMTSFRPPLPGRTRTQEGQAPVVADSASEWVPSPAIHPIQAEGIPEPLVLELPGPLLPELVEEPEIPEELEIPVVVEVVEIPELPFPPQPRVMPSPRPRGRRCRLLLESVVHPRQSASTAPPAHSSSEEASPQAETIPPQLQTLPQPSSDQVVEEKKEEEKKEETEKAREKKVGPARPLSPDSPRHHKVEEDPGKVQSQKLPPPPSPLLSSVAHVAVQTDARRVSGRRIRRLLSRRRALIMAGTNGHTNGHSKTFTEGMAARILQICQGQDADSRITYVGRDEDGRTIVRVRGGNGSSVISLQRALGNLMPFARVRTSEDVLDGSVQTQIVIPTSGDEWTLAYQTAKSHLANRLLGILGFTVTMFGVGVWAASIINAEASDI